jgi:hypothetical protein
LPCCSGDETLANERGRPALTIFTIGHSTRPAETFLEFLAGHQIQRLDIRKIPKSRQNPQCGGEVLAVSLAAANIHCGIDVCEISSVTLARPHGLTPWTHVEGTHIVCAA